MEIIETLLNVYLWKQIGIAAAIFFVFLLIRRVFVRYVLKTVFKLLQRSKTDLDVKLLLAFEGPLKAFIVVLGIYFAFVYLPLTPYQDLLVLKFFRGFIIAIITWALYNLIGAYLFEELGSKLGLQIDKILIPFLTKVLRFIVIVLGLSIIAQEWGYNVSGFIAGLGLGGLAFALAAKDAIANIFGGIVIITDKPFSIGDWILTPSVEGTVEDISFRSTKVRTFANALVTVPNATLSNEAITNWTRMGKRRVSFYLGVTYTTTREKLEQCVKEIKDLLVNHPEVHKETIFVHFNDFNDSSLDIFIYFFTVTTVWGEYLRVREDINLKIMRILEGKGVSIAFPSRSIYMESPVNYYPVNIPSKNDEKT